MGEKAELRRDLLARIEARRTAVQYFLRENRPGVRRRANTTIVLSSLAAVFTAGPALGGKTFAEGVQNLLRLSDDTGTATTPAQRRHRHSDDTGTATTPMSGGCSAWRPWWCRWEPR
jgi:hypothetical protein